MYDMLKPYVSFYESRRGIETEYNDDMSSVLSHNGDIGFDFVVAPLMDPNYRPSLIDSASKHSNVLPFAGSDLVLSPSQWSSYVVGKISSWIDLDSEDDVLREDSEIALKQELAWASHLSLQACLLPTPKGKSCGNYARCVTQILHNLDNMKDKMELWLRIPLAKSDDDDATISSSDGTVLEVTDSWELWNSFRLLCEHHSQLSVALDVQSSLPSISSIGRWADEPVKAALLHTECYLTDAQGDPCLSICHQNLLSGFFYYSIHIVLSESSQSAANQTDTVAQQVPRDDLEPYLDYVELLYLKKDSVSKKELNELGFRDTCQYGFRDTRQYGFRDTRQYGLTDTLQYPLQPLDDTDFTAKVYETFEKDSVKYIQYQRAVSKALMDRIPDDMASITTTVLMVVGAGRGPLVRASLQAAEETGRKLKVYAVEKNPNAVVTLHSLVKIEGWENIVTVISCDMRCWDAPEQADILVSELLGSFGDNQLSPECLDGAQRFLKPDGISIPSSYTSFIQPVTTTKLYNDIKSHEDFEVAHVVRMDRFAQLSPSQTVFTFNHPNYSPNKSNQRYKKLRFSIPIETGSTIVHGFAGYFDAVLYKDVHISTEPTTATPNMSSWFPLFFPLRSPVYVKAGSPIDFHIWRCCGNIKVWYEWCVTSPTKSPVHNSDGRSSGIWLYNQKLGQTE